MLDYLQLYPETIEQLKRYNKEQRCNLYEAMAEYAFTGKEPDWPDDAPEWFIWETLKQQVNRTEKKVNQKRANASSSSETELTEAKPSETKRSRANKSETELTEAKPSETRNYDNESEIEKEICNNHSSARANPFTVSEDELAEALERDRQIEDASRAWGLPCNEGNMIKARDMAREYSLDWLLRAIETAGNGKEQTWRYVAGILKSWKENGGPDAPKKQRASPVKTVSAQRYGQREYTEEELNSVGPDLLADAERERAYQESVVLETTDETMNRLLDEAKEQRSTA